MTANYDVTIPNVLEGLYYIYIYISLNLESNGSLCNFSMRACPLDVYTIWYGNRGAEFLSGLYTDQDLICGVKTYGTASIYWRLVLSLPGCQGVDTWPKRYFLVQ